MEPITWAAIFFIGWLEMNQHPNPACFDRNIKMLPEMCHAGFNRNEEDLSWIIQK